MFKVLILTVIVVIQITDGFTYQKIHRRTEICGSNNGHRRYLELGETGEILAHNITVPSYVQEVSKQFNQSLIMQCTLELVTCTSCSIRLKFDYINFMSNCPNPKNGAGICRCDYIILSEPPYDDKQRNLVHNCGTVYEYQTRTRTLQIKFIYWNNYTEAFRVEYTVDQNRELITSSSSAMDSSEVHNDKSYRIESPFFPAYYPRDYATEHIIKCDFELCRIRIEFSDFLISRSSSMEFIDTSGERFYVTGKTFRPPFLVSSGASVTIRFNANGGTDLGYRAKIVFLSADDLDEVPQTNCGGFVDTIGGVITMLNMSRKDGNDSNPVIYECIWIVKPPEAYLQIKSHISLRVQNFEKMAGDSEIQIHQGITSDKPMIELLRSSRERSVSSRNLVAPLTAGFYVRLRGKFSSLSRLAIVYSAFSYSKCYTGNEFMCLNQRCISLMLQCDGFDHCGDNSDEPESCSEMWETSLYDRRWYSHTPNYYFPKLDRFPEIKPTSLAFVISSLSLLLVISCLIMMVHRNGNRIREQEELQNQLQTISQLLDANNNNNNRPEEIVEPPPIYENPPDYDEIIKIGMDEQMNQVKREKKSGRRSRLHRPRRSDPAVSVQRALLEVAALEESDLPSTSSLGGSVPPSPYFTNSESNPTNRFQIIDIEEATEASTQNGGSSPTPANYVSSNSSVCSHGAAKFQTEPKNTTDESISPQPSSSALYDFSEPKHLWSDDSKFKKSWILFNSDDCSLKIPHDSSHNNGIYDSVDIAQMQEVDDYFKSYAANKANIQPSDSKDSFVSTKSCFCDSTQSIFSHQIKASLLSNKTECDRCKNLIYEAKNRRCSMCGDCVENLYSPKVCMTCNGRISFQDLKNLNIKHQFAAESDRIDDVSAIKLCNCFPKYPSQNFSSIQSNDANEIQVLPKIAGKSCSYNEIVHQSRRRKATQYFSSHNCIPLKTSSSSDDESSDDD